MPVCWSPFRVPVSEVPDLCCGPIPFTPLDLPATATPHGHSSDTPIESRPESPVWAEGQGQRGRLEPSPQAGQQGMAAPAVVATHVGCGRGSGMVVMRIAGTSHVAGHQGEIGHRGGQIQLTFRLGPTQAASLSHAQLHQAGQSVLRRHPELAILGEFRDCAAMPGPVAKDLPGDAGALCARCPVGRPRTVAVLDRRRTPRPRTEPRLFCRCGRCGRCGWPWAPGGASPVRPGRYRCPLPDR